MRSEYTEAHSETDMPSYRLLPEQEVKKPYSPGLWQGAVRNRKAFERKTVGTKEQENLPTLQTMVKQRENRHYHHNSKYKTAFLISHKKSRISTYMISTITINARPFLSICYYSEPSLIR